MRVLVLDDTTRAEIKRVCAFADARRISLADLLRNIKSGESIGDDSNYRCELPFGYRIVFSIEQQPEPLGWTRHISVSVDGKDLPNPIAVETLMTEFGFRGTLKSTKVYIEHEKAINAVEPLECPPAKMNN